MLNQKYILPKVFDALKANPTSEFFYGLRFEQNISYFQVTSTGMFLFKINFLKNPHLLLLKKPH